MAFPFAAGNVARILGLTTPGQQDSSLSLPVVPSPYEYKSVFNQLAGDDDTHNLALGSVIVLPTFDVVLSEAEPNNNFGISNFINFGNRSGTKRHSLMYFDLSAIGTVTEAKLMLYDTDNSARAATMVANVHRILSGNSGWVEGTKDAAGATLTDPTWNKKTQTPSVNWAGSAGCSTAGTDYASTIMGSVTATDGVAGWLEIDLDISEFNTMKSANYGLLLKGADEATTNKLTVVHSAEYADNASLRPYLQVLSDSALNTAETIFVIADAEGATFSNGPSATSNDVPIPTTGAYFMARTGGIATAHAYVPTGVNVWYAGLGPR